MSADGLRAALEAAWFGNWSLLIRRLRGDAPLSRIERNVLADALATLVEDGKLKAPRGIAERDLRMQIGEYVRRLEQEGVNKAEAVRRAEDEFLVETATVYKACREYEDSVWTSPLPDRTE